MKIYVGAIDLMGATGDWRAFLNKAKEAGASGVRIFICYSWNGPQPISPYKQVGTWAHPTSGHVFLKYRLREWNPVDWKKLWDVLVYMKNLGLEAWLVAEDYCSLKGNKDDKYNNPMYCSEEALGPTTPGGVWGEAQKPYHANLYYRTIFWAKQSGCPFIFEVMNETNIVDGTPEHIIAWNKWANDMVHKYGVLRARMTASPPGELVPQMANQTGIISPHGIGTPDAIKPMFGLSPTRLLFSTDGFKKGTGRPDQAGGRGIGTDVAGAIAKRLNTVNAYGFELFDRGIWRQNNNRANLDDFNPEILKLMAGVE